MSEIKREEVPVPKQFKYEIPIEKIRAAFSIPKDEEIQSGIINPESLILRTAKKR